VIVRETGYEPSIHLFRIRTLCVARSQAGLNVAHRYLPVKARQSASHCGGRVSLNEYKVGVFMHEDGFQPRQDS
jgi:hypothetical protein